MTIISPKIYLYASSSYSQIDTPPEARQSIEFAPSGVDLVRYRLGDVYNSNLDYVRNSNSNAASIAYKFRTNDPITTDSNYFGPYAAKEFLNLEPKSRDPGGSFAPNSDDTFNKESSVNNWCNSFSEINGVDNPFEIKRCITDEAFSDHGFIFDFAVDERYKKLVNNPSNMKGASVDVVYNYYNQTYENVMNYQSYSGSTVQTNQFELEEKLLPSYYALSAVIGEQLSQTSRESIDIASLNGVFDAFKYNVGNQRLSLTETDYFSEYARNIFSLRNSNQSEQILTTIRDKQKNVVLQQSQLSDLIRDTDDILSAGS